MSDKFAYYDRDADIAWLPTGESSDVVCEEVEWGLIDHESSTDEVVAVEVWSASKRLPPEVLATLPAPAGRTVQPPNRGDGGTDCGTGRSDRMSKRKTRPSSTPAKPFTPTPRMKEAMTTAAAKEINCRLAFRTVRGMVIAIAVILVSALVGCGDSTVAERAGQDASAKRDVLKGGSQGRQAEMFAGTREFCEMEPRSEFAVSEGLPADASVTAVARVYASDWPEGQRMQAYKACKAGLENVPVRYPASASAAREIWGRDFVAFEVTGEEREPPVLRPLYIRLSFSDEREHGIGWKARCNGFGGNVRFTATKMKVSQVAHTQMGCMPEVEKEDDWLARFMEADPEWHLGGQRLRLISGDATIELRGSEDPNVCLVSGGGVRIELGNSGIGCENALDHVALYAEGYDQSWDCRETELANGKKRVLCREGEKWFAIRGFDLEWYEGRLRVED